MTEHAAVRTLIVDDEPVARAGMRQMLAEVEWIACIGEAAHGLAAVEAINALKPELVFLDVQMPGLLGTEVLQRIEHQPFVVFTTAFAEYAVIAFELGALDYVLKPFGPERLSSTLERIRGAIGEPAPAALDRLGEAMAQGPISRLFVRNGRSIVPVAVENIHWIEAVGDYVAVHDGSANPHLLHLSLSKLEQRLDPERFTRIHRTHMVNLDQVSAFKRQLNGNLVAELRDGTELAVSRARAQALRSLAQ
ncbi:MAG: response regulator transcription factor [Xanthomonadales bacterium]|nr:response regulator transcription factor [Xanthomonadales bacterium]